MKNLWLDIGNTRLKYWITQEDQILEQGAIWGRWWTHYHPDFICGVYSSEL
jgi:pantothenate kinase type III